MAVKALFSFAALVAVTLGLLLPTPGAHKAQAQKSMFTTLDVRR